MAISMFTCWNYWRSVNKRLLLHAPLAKHNVLVLSFSKVIPCFSIGNVISLETDLPCLCSSIPAAQNCSFKYFYLLSSSLK